MNAEHIWVSPEQGWAWQAPLLGDTCSQEYSNGEVSKRQASFLSEWGHLSNTAIQAWKEQSLLFKVALPGGLPFTGAKKLITQTNKQPSSFMACQWVHHNDFFSSQKRTKYRTENCIEVYLSWVWDHFWLASQMGAKMATSQGSCVLGRVSLS